MGWKEEAYRLLRLKLGSKTFSSGQAVSLLSKEKGFSEGTAYRLIHDLAKTAKLERLGRGLYRFPKAFRVSLSESISMSTSVSGVSLSGPDEVAKKALGEKSVRFMITGPSLLYPFAHHFPRRMIHLVYTISGGGETAWEALRETGLRCLLKPSRHEIELALKEFPEKNLFIIRETSNLEGGIRGVADLERSLVDTYFETTRKRIPYPPEEFGRMISKVMATKNVNVSHVLRLAGRRGIKAELRTILENLVPDLKLPGRHARNDKVETVLAGIAAEGR